MPRIVATRHLPHPRPRDSASIALFVAAIAEVIWTFYLAINLPQRYVAQHWWLAWTGLDIAECALVIVVAWAIWKQRAELAVVAPATAMLFAIDAWFDVTTARRGSIAQSVFFAAVLEVPFAIALVWIGLRSLRTQQRGRIVEEDSSS